MKKIAIVLFNLGGPDSLEAVRPFLFNLFYDRSIIDLTNPLRWIVAKLISSRREKEARKIYNYIGGRSPIFELTRDQAFALESLLSTRMNAEVKTFISMRYWHPFSRDTIAEVKDYQPDEIILLPLYPHYSTTTTKSSLDDWKKENERVGYIAETKKVYNYHTQDLFIESHARLISHEYNKAYQIGGNPRILFSAHGLPERTIKQRKDPYPQQIEESVEAIISRLNIDNVDYVTCYQSRVGPLKWIGPSTEDEIIRAARDNVPVVIVPISFVSEHSETLVELDIEYRDLANEYGLTNYFRVPALGTDPLFIESLAQICEYVSFGEYNPSLGIYSSHPARARELIDDFLDE